MIRTTLLLIKVGITLRVRKEDSNWLLCLKMKLKDKNQFLSSIEIEKQITAYEFECFKSNPSKLVEKISYDKVDLGDIVDSSKLTLLGYIENERQKINLVDNFLFELDHSLFPGGHEFFELEVEGVRNDGECNYIMNALTEMGIQFNLNKKSKYKRFVECISVV
ncbi:hypothetical protein [Paenibacillus sp. 1001270B_150601_E10]|uniref:hypothetical protein n=1 Tax=Paenibacillus sp. 1001270B_150601_E10 TaxID=2787079 RepID=UPI001E2C3674|nr:hypothetical protein [Paenibacillus sp. 1001270B_150601_E10]